MGESGGTHVDVGPANSDEVFRQLSDDIIAGIELLKRRFDIRADRIGVYGVSQGGWIAPLTAARSSDVSFMVIVSDPTVTVGEEIYYSELSGAREGAGADASGDQLSELLAAYDGPRGFDPVVALEAIDVPALWLLGGADRSIPTRGIGEAILAASAPGRRPRHARCSQWRARAGIRPHLPVASGQSRRSLSLTARAGRAVHLPTSFDGHSEPPAPRRALPTGFTLGPLHDRRY